MNGAVQKSKMPVRAFSRDVAGLLANILQSANAAIRKVKPAKRDTLGSPRHSQTDVPDRMLPFLQGAHNKSLYEQTNESVVATAADFKSRVKTFLVF